MLRSAFTFYILFLVFLATEPMYAQVTDSIATADTAVILDEVTVQAYEYKKPLLKVPAAVGLIDKTELSRFNDASLLPAINTVPGVRMEERSPGSYRLSIRGSTLRSPFGIRNVKVYWNDLPFTDPGGNTYLNLIDPSTIQQLEIIKGPGSSLYGAGTGGVVLISSSSAKVNHYEAYVSGLAGSYGLFRTAAGVENHQMQSDAAIHYAHQQYSGYRNQSALRRDVVQAQGKYQLGSKRMLSANFLYVDLTYETPGALTLEEFNENPRLSRPAAGINRSASEQHAAVYNKTMYAGVSQEYDFNNRLSNRTGAYLSFTQFDNPAIRNYERRVEQSFGARSTTHFHGKNFNIIVGGEFQHGFSPIKTYGNRAGEIDTLQTDEEITSTTGLFFIQSDINLPADFFLTVGGSLNFNHVDYKELAVVPVVDASKNFKPVFSPRIALLKKLHAALSGYISISQGFSPPTVSELYPSNTIFNRNLKAERGTNYEIGFRGEIMKHLNIDIASYIFLLTDAITIRRMEDGGEYFVNAGNTKQRGLEFKLAYNPALSQSGFVSEYKIWTGLTLNRYNFMNYKNDTIDFSGNQLTGVAPHIFTMAADMTLLQAIYFNITGSYTDRIPLDDANTAFSQRYILLGARIGYKPAFKSMKFDFFFSADNLLNQQYSLGSDLNAQGKRYYNAAPGRNFSGGIKITFAKTKK